jgi:S1-C subfamily serine protease
VVAGLSTPLVERCRKATGKVICGDFGQTGSGFFINNTGLFLTNNHVVSKMNVDDAGTIRLDYSRQIYVKLGSSMNKASLAMDENSDQPVVFDYAFLKVDGLPTEHIDIADLSQVAQGEPVLAIGYPEGFDVPIITSGVISAILPRPSHINALHIMKTFLTDTLVTYGSSGGPLVRLSDGTVIGIVTMPHEIRSTIKKRLEKHLTSSDEQVTPPIRDLIDYVFTYLQGGYNYAISIEHSVSDAVFQTKGGVTLSAYIH